MKSFAGNLKRECATPISLERQTRKDTANRGHFHGNRRAEKEHAKRMFKYLEGGMLEITSTFPAGVIGNTAENLEAAAAGENEEWTELYPHFADVAEEEGFKEIATMYRMIAKAEAIHEERYLKLLQRVKDETVFLRDEKIEWQCRNCGYVHEGKKALKTCPACLHSQAYFEVKCDKYY